MPYLKHGCREEQIGFLSTLFWESVGEKLSNWLVGRTEYGLWCFWVGLELLVALFFQLHTQSFPLCLNNDSRFVSCIRFNIFTCIFVRHVNKYWLLDFLLGSHATLGLYKKLLQRAPKALKTYSYLPISIVLVFLAGLPISHCNFFLFLFFMLLLLSAPYLI